MEHIYPQTQDGINWPKINPEEVDDFVGQIGNLALLHPDDNLKRGNSSFAAAKTIYEGSKLFDQTRDIGSYATDGIWDQVAIKARATSLAELALSVWPIVPISAAPPSKPKKMRVSKGKP